MRILVVEDEHRVANTIKKGLEQESYTVTVAYSGTDGYDIAATEAFDALVLDQMLPGMDGTTICKQLRADNIHTPILMLTAKSQLEDKVIGLNAGADDYLTKPFAFAELVARLRALTRRPAVVVSNKLSYKDLCLDTQTFTVVRGKQTITLSHKEFSLLEYFLRHPNVILSKDHIITHVWEYDADILPNTVEVYIKKLRAKLDIPFPNRQAQIHTVRGFGYKLN